MVIKKFYILIAFLVFLSFVSGDEAKGSVTFVIDDTSSMGQELAHVKARTDDIFEAVLNSNISQIDEFIIVTFNDPDVYFQVKTNESLEFKSALGEIIPHGGFDCPEMAMTGIQHALYKSKPHSFLYVFTDASAKDYWLYDDVKALAQEKSIQVNFLLTGDCEGKIKTIIEEQQTLYDNLAAATSGQVFHIFKVEIDKIIEYILANLRSKRINLLRKTYGYYSCENSAFTVDSKVWDILIALSSPAPLNHNDLVVHGPHGHKTSLEGFIYSQKTSIFKMRGEPGEYTIKIEDCADVTVVVSASTSVSFRHGFSSVKPSTLDETSTKPVPGTESYLAIALSNEERDVTLKSVEIRDMDSNLIAPLLTLQLIDDEKQFYSTDLFTPPKETFMIAVNGYTKSNENITRVSQTSIEYHKPLREEENDIKMPPTVTVIGPKEVHVEYHMSVELKCKVNGIPKPRIWWEDEFLNFMPYSKVIEIAPYEYITTLHVLCNVTNNVTFICLAKNFAENSDNVTVIVKNKSFLNVLEYPKDITVEFGNMVELNFKIDAQPPAKIDWYQDDVKIKNNEDMEIITSSEGSSLKIKSATPSLEGKYSVMASNVNHKEKFELKITVTMKKMAAIVNMIEKNDYDEQSIMLNCKVEGFPEPIITWEDQYHNVLPSKITRKTPPYEYISTLQIDKATESGTYTCKAKNFHEDSESVKVVIQKEENFDVLEYPKDITVEFGDPVELDFKIDAQPTPKINWYQDDVEIKSNEDMEIITSPEGSSLKIKSAKPSIDGKYSVMASNVHHKEKYEFKITVTTKEKAAIVTILGDNEATADEERSLTLNCKVEGFPEPSITWEDQYHNVLPSKITKKSPPYEYISTLQIDKAIESGTYICKAKNFEEDSKSVKVILKKKKKFNVLEYPKDTTVKYGESVELNLKIDAKPPAKIIWYQNNKEIKSNHHFHVSFDSSVLKIMNAQPRLQGRYYVKASNSDKQVGYEFHVTVTGTEVPSIDKNNIRYTKLRGGSIDIECRLIQGKPEPVISWSFDRDSAGKLIHLEEETTERIHIDHVTKNDVGTYRCDVSNVVGTDHHEMQLYVEYAPIVKISPSKLLESKKDERVKLACEVDGSPAPIVRWFVNGSQIYHGRKYTIYPDYTLSFTGLISDSGKYSCEASNDLKTVRAGVYVFIYVPTKIKPPVESKFDVKLRSTLILSCEANGYPEPKVQWFHYSNLPRKTNPEKINCDKNYNVILHKIQFKDEGFYKCTADNNIDSAEITYTVNVQVPATIHRKMVKNDLQVVEGDPSFVLTCPATGSPKPTIKWQHDGIEIGSDALFKISKDGSLTVNNVVSRHRGTYTCTAQNQYSKDTMNYEVYVHAFPPMETNPLIITIIEGEKKHDMYCGMVPEKQFVFRWFKDGVFITKGDLTLIDVTKDYAGYYTCRISTPGRSYSYHKRVIVGTEPKFITAHNPTVMFKDEAEATFDCSATGDPLPTITWWYEHIKIINADSNQYTFKMDLNNIGNYSCHVSNEFRTIKRSFDIIAGECLMSLENDFTARQPMLVTGKKKRQWPIFNVSGGTLRMQKYREFKLVCPNAVISYDNTTYGSILETSCVGDSMLELRGMAVKASEITCDRPLVPLAKNLTESKCRGSNTKRFNIGFDVDGAFVSVFSVCLNEITNTTLFVTHRMHKAIADTIPKYVAGYTRGTLLRIQFEDIYDCRNQEYAISTFMGKTVDEKCCFKRRQLVNPMDVLPGISQVATYHYLNVVPHWSCGTENWDEVERRVRQYAIDSQDKITIWTGSTSVIKDVPTIKLKDKLGQELLVPQFIWKVVQRQLAIIYINVPGLTSLQAKSYTLCLDICDSIDWMRNSQWHNFDKGFIYCCAIKEFERAFNYDYIFK